METENLLEQNPPISDELYNSVKKQVMRRFMSYMRIPVDPTVAVELYANSIDGISRINNSHTNKDGTDNTNPMNFGNTYEEQEVTEFNRLAILNNCNLRAERTDNLSQMENLPESLRKYANLHDQHSDIVIFDKDTGEVVARAQLKHTNDVHVLTREAYTTSQDAPDIILVPSDTEEKHELNLQKRAQHGHSEESRQRAQIASEKLAGGLVDSKYTEKIDKDNEALEDSFSLYGQLHKYANDHPSFARTIPYVRQTETLITDTVDNIGSKAVAGILPVLMGGVLYEIKDAYEHQNSMSWKERLNRFLKSVLSSLKTSLKNSILAEIINGILGFIAGIFKDAAQLLTTFASAIHQICGHIYDYIAGKIQNFADLTAVCLKALSIAGIGTLCVMLEKFVTTNFPVIPELLVALLCAALGGIAMVFASKAIDAVVYTLVNMLSAVDAARLKREEIEKYINDTLPNLVESSDKLDIYVKSYIRRQEAVLNSSYAEITKIFSDDTYTAWQFADKINSVQESLGLPRFADNHANNIYHKLLKDSDTIHGRS